MDDLTNLDLAIIRAALSEHAGTSTANFYKTEALMTKEKILLECAFRERKLWVPRKAARFIVCSVFKGIVEGVGIAIGVVIVLVVGKYIFPSRP